MTNISDLKKEEYELRKRAERLQDKREALERLAMIPDLEKNVIGKFFKYRNNYGGDDKGWWLYQYVIGFSGPDFNIPNPTFKVFSFQTCTDGRTEIRHEKYSFHSSIGPDQITRGEFMRAYEKMLKIIALPF